MRWSRRIWALIPPHRVHDPHEPPRERDDGDQLTTTRGDFDGRFAQRRRLAVL